jgi:hypothetical protein
LRGTLGYLFSSLDRQLGSSRFPALHAAEFPQSDSRWILFLRTSRKPYRLVRLALERRTNGFLYNPKRILGRIPA